MSKRTCSVDRCDRVPYGRGWCSMHYQRWRRTGDPLGVPQYDSHLQRLLAYCDQNGPTPPRRPELGPCWHWLKPLDRDGYAKTKIDGRQTFVHRAMYTLLVGPIPEGMTLDHLCHDPRSCAPGRGCAHRRCVNPAHLEPVSPRVNVLRGGGFPSANVLKTHCPQGHEYTPENTRVVRGGRVCIECGRRRSREHQRKKRAETAGGRP